MRWILILYFTCGHGCGAPALVELPQHYGTWEQCQKAGDLSLAPNANPMHAVRTFACQRIR
jgi:hypothetical protein